jgi:hypothetical protein
VCTVREIRLQLQAYAAWYCPVPTDHIDDEIDVAPGRCRPPLSRISRHTVKSETPLDTKSLKLFPAGRPAAARPSISVAGRPCVCASATHRDVPRSHTPARSWPVVAAVRRGGHAHHLCCAGSIERPVDTCPWGVDVAASCSPGMPACRGTGGRPVLDHGTSTSIRPGPDLQIKATRGQLSLQVPPHAARTLFVPR